MQNEKYILSFLRLCICSPYLPVALGQVHWKLCTLRGWRSRTSARSWRRSRRRCSWPTFPRPGNILLLRRVYWSHSQSKHVIEGRFFFHNLFRKVCAPQCDARLRHGAVRRVQLCSGQASLPSQVRRTRAVKRSIGITIGFHRFASLVAERIYNLELREDDIWVVSYP